MTAQEIADYVLGPVSWTSPTHGFCACPGAHLHTKATKDTDCEVYVDECAHVHCFHGSCAEVRDVASTRLRMELEAAGIHQHGARPDRERRKKVRFEPERLAALELGGLTRDHLAGWSPVRDPHLLSGREFLGVLYRAEGASVLVFVGDNENQGTHVYPRDAWPTGHSNGAWFLPQPVTGGWITNPRTGRKTRRSSECCTHFPYLVAESDEVSEAQWLSFLVQLEAPIVAVYTSGGRSIHALIYVGAATKEEWGARTEGLRETLITHGADAKSLTAVRLTRLPGVWRGDQPQLLLYLNPDARPRAIYADQTA